MFLGKELRISLLLSSTLLLLWAARLEAQSPARLDGTVLDASGAAVPGAQVNLTNAATGVVSKTSTGGAGEYVFAFALPGSYSLSVTHPGFRVTTETVVLHANDHVAVNVKLSVAAANESVKVSAEEAAVPITDSGQRSETLTSQQIQAYSTESTDAEELLELLPGVTVNSLGDSGYGNKFNSSVVSSAT